ncbi:MAG TPA: metal ABC transporter permease [Herpetosiphonaceae bacterium]
MLNWFNLQTYLEPLQYPFMQRGLLAVVLVGVLCALVGSFVVLRGLAFMGEAMRHALFAGVVISFLLGGSLMGGALIFALIVAWLIGVVGRQQGIGEDTAIGVFFSGSFALGIVLLNFARSGVRDLATILLGDVLGISTFDLVLTAVVVVVVAALIGFFYKELVLIAFDPALAAAQGRSLALWDGLLLVLLALALTTAFQTVGNLLVLALLLAPAATARLLTQRMITMLLLAAGLAVTAGVVGLYISYWRNLPSGPTIVLLSGALFGLALLFAPRSGLAQSFRQRRRLRKAARSSAA